MKAHRLLDRPIIERALHDSLGDNIDGPSLIRVPDWVPSRLGRYYLYFAHHNGRHIRMAYADALEGPWTVHEPGVLSLADSTCFDHIASPDVHVDEAGRCIRMYFHGVAFPPGTPTDGHERLFGEAGRWIGNQRTKVAESPDGLRFRAEPAILGASYWRAFSWQGRSHALAMPGVFYRAQGDGWELGPMPFDWRFRHCAVEVRGGQLDVFFTRVGDAPERILHTAIDLRKDWRDWSHGEVTEVLAPECAWEGAGLDLAPSLRGPVFTPVRQLRDPALYVEEGTRYLLYAAAGEQAIGLARLDP